MLIDLAKAAFALFGWWLLGCSVVVSVASLVVMLTPTPRDDHWTGRVYWLVELLALTVGRAKDLPPNRRPPPAAD